MTTNNQLSNVPKKVAFFLEANNKQGGQIEKLV